jgi:hypothetical protein
VPEDYRQKSRNLRRINGQTYVEFLREKDDLFTKWCTSVEALDHKSLCNLLLVEELKGVSQ